jgi:serine/threonine protein kinase
MTDDYLSDPDPVSPSAPAAVPLLPEGERLGVWRIVQPLQACASGHWYKAEHALAIDDHAAVLVFHHADDAKAVLLRFADGQADGGGFGRPGLIATLDSGLTPAGLPYLVLAWVEGQPLLPAAMDLPLNKRLQLVLELCELLDAAHQQGMVLRELDPSMLWLTPAQHLYLMGQGLVSQFDAADNLDAPFCSAARPFVAPELAAGMPPSDASEAYAVGMLLCLLVNGRLPKQETQNAPVRSLATWLSLTGAQRYSLDALLHKAVAESLAQRHVSPQALARDIQAWMSGESHSALAHTPVPTLVPEVEPMPSAPSRRRKSRPWARWLVALAAICLCASLAWLAYQHRRAKPELPPPASSASAEVWRELQERAQPRLLSALPASAAALSHD